MLTRFHSTHPHGEPEPIIRIMTRRLEGMLNLLTIGSTCIIMIHLVNTLWPLGSHLMVNHPIYFLHSHAQWPGGTVSIIILNAPE